MEETTTQTTNRKPLWARGADEPDLEHLEGNWQNCQRKLDQLKKQDKELKDLCQKEEVILPFTQKGAEKDDKGKVVEVEM